MRLATFIIMLSIASCAQPKNDEKETLNAPTIVPPPNQSPVASSKEQITANPVKEQPVNLGGSYKITNPRWELVKTITDRSVSRHDIVDKELKLEFSLIYMSDDRLATGHFAKIANSKNRGYELYEPKHLSRLKILAEG